MDLVSMIIKARRVVLQQKYYKSNLVHSGFECARYDLIFGTEWGGSDGRCCGQRQKPSHDMYNCTPARKGISIDCV